MVIESEIVTAKRAAWQGRTNVGRFAEQIRKGHAAQLLKDQVEVDVVRRYGCGERFLDVGIGTGRISLPLLRNGLRLTGIDASAAMIELCARDARAEKVHLVQGELERLPFGRDAFDTVISVDTFGHFPGWVANLDELLRVTSAGGRVIVDVGSSEHVDAVARSRGSRRVDVQAPELGTPEAYTLRLSLAELRAYAVERQISLLALVPYGAILGSLVPNYWISESYLSRSGGIDHLISWIGADPLLRAFAEFIERRIIQRLPPAASGRMFAVFERRLNGDVYHEPWATAIAERDERGPDVWRTEFDAHVQHEPNRIFAVAFVLAAWPVRLPVDLRDELPPSLLVELERTERAANVDDIATEIVAAWHSEAKDVTFRGVELADVFGFLLEGELRGRFSANE